MLHLNTLRHTHARTDGTYGEDAPPIRDHRMLGISSIGHRASRHGPHVRGQARQLTSVATKAGPGRRGRHPHGGNPRARGLSTGQRDSVRSRGTAQLHALERHEEEVVSVRQATSTAGKGDDRPRVRCLAPASDCDCRAGHGRHTAYSFRLGGVGRWP